ncbi:MAG: hypothetical protein WD355_12150 [Balneolaceae bacterium]
MKSTALIILFLFCIATPARGQGDTSDPLIRYGGRSAQLTIYQISDRTLEIRLEPIHSAGGALPMFAEPELPAGYSRDEVWSGRAIMDPVRGKLGSLHVELLRSPLRIIFRRDDGSIIQELSWPDNTGWIHFRTEAPVFGPISDTTRMDLRGSTFFQSDNSNPCESPADGSGVVTHWLTGADGWSLFVYHPAGSKNRFDLSGEFGIFQPDEQMLSDPLVLLVSIREEPDGAYSTATCRCGWLDCFLEASEEVRPENR